MDSSSPNYDYKANFDDKTCSSGRRRRLDSSDSSTEGCLDPTATNYDSAASLTGNCTYEWKGCMDSAASNYLWVANVEAECFYDVYGCTDEEHSDNYNPNATITTGCNFVILGCMDSAASNYAYDANIITIFEATTLKFYFTRGPFPSYSFLGSCSLYICYLLFILL